MDELCRLCEMCRRKKDRYFCNADFHPIEVDLNGECVLPGFFFPRSADGTRGPAALDRPGLQKRCTQCGKSFPATREYFNVYAVITRGRKYQYLRPDCKECRKRTQAEYRFNKKYPGN